ncbi:MAG: hypothetical protein H0W65_07865 [Sphingomonas sp.]|uniref:hypothetical protein n=1 Tax=Sphingomonas sp. TaxID=28214 RepID=UPI00182952D8|nr:hypothetical protein [Sphingomonas sp.]MBA3667623.1 hypothetical protein [Sphingomonas sp.]
MTRLLLTILFASFGLLLPWGLALSRRLQVKGEEVMPGRIGWRPVVHSLLAYVLSFNLTFFLQELFLVLPKALVPGLHPTLFHNDHDWTGDAPIAELFQGTGAVAILISGLLFARIAAKQARPSLFVLWMAFHGLFQSLPQFIVGAIVAENDVGRAYDYLGIGAVGEAAVAVLALAALPVAGLWLGRRFLASAWEGAPIASQRNRFGYFLWMAGFPALAAVPILILFRAPRELIEVLLPPMLVMLFGYGWMQLAAFRTGPVKGEGEPPRRLVSLLVATLLLLASFQLVLRPGISF